MEVFVSELHNEQQNELFSVQGAAGREGRSFSESSSEKHEKNSVQVSRKLKYNYFLPVYNPTLIS